MSFLSFVLIRLGGIWACVSKLGVGVGYALLWTNPARELLFIYSIGNTTIAHPYTQWIPRKLDLNLTLFVNPPTNLSVNNFFFYFLFDMECQILSLSYTHVPNKLSWKNLVRFEIEDKPTPLAPKHDLQPKQISLLFGLGQVHNFPDLHPLHLTY